MWKGLVRRAGAAGRFVSSLNQLFESKDKTSDNRYRTLGDLSEQKPEEDTDNGSKYVTDDTDSDSISTKSDGDAEPNVYQFGSDTALQESFTFRHSNTFDEKGIDQRQTKLEEPLPSKFVRRSQPNCPHKKFKREPYFDISSKRKRNTEDTDSEIEEGQDDYIDTSDYFSGVFQPTEDVTLNKATSGMFSVCINQSSSTTCFIFVSKFLLI